MIRRIERSALVEFSPRQMFDIVNDVAAYPEFLPWCKTGEVLTQDADEMTARLGLSGLGFEKQFTTRNTLSAPDRITISLIDGPFTMLEGSWQFLELGEDGSKVVMTLSFEVSRGVLSSAISRVFDSAADRMVEAFCKRAGELYGS